MYNNGSNVSYAFPTSVHGVNKHLVKQGYHTILRKNRLKIYIRRKKKYEK